MDNWVVGTLLDFKISASQEAEADAVIETKNGQKIKCFVDYFSIQKMKKFKLDSNIKVFLGLVCFQIEKSKEGKKAIVDIRKNARGVNQYKLSGQVIHSSENKIVLDCGFPIEVTVYEKNIASGAWIEATGRIDLYLV